uniref:Lipase maturation factor n=1 Tax=Crassostrea virginica TaxID=6565 RepID=A0A8B8DF39_CRAVI|nr:lipase maturation factor 2-like [Crassostrea virginica]
MTGIRETRDFFLCCISVIYLIAFSSLYVQIPGLYGDNGILPAKLAMEDKEISSWEEILEGQPTLLRLMPKLGLSTETGMDLICLLGILISFCCVVFSTARDMVSFTLLWMMYLSLYQVGQTFLWFQWDILLLETGFLTILVAPLNLQFLSSRHHHHDRITLWLVRWLLFRLMFASGVVKLTSGCPTWWGLTALTVHFESQCIPTALAWFWHHLPQWFLKLSCVATYVIEIPIPLMFFSPVKSMRMFAFYSQIALQMLIIVTGNYNFFNLLTIALCISLVEDDFIKRHKVKKLPRIQSYFNWIFSLVVYGSLIYQIVMQFSLRILFSPSFEIKSKIAFSKEQFSGWLENLVPVTIILGAVSLGYHIVSSLFRCLVKEKGIWKLWSLAQCAVMAIVAVAMFSLSLIPYTVLDQDSTKFIPNPVFRMNEKLDSFQLTSSYGLFRVMTGVGGRPEVIIEGSNSVESGWKEYEFYYKPGNISRVPPIVAPHQPRLDWQMWFAALGSYQHNTWFVHLIYRLLTGQREVLDLIQHNPFPDKPPKFIRAKLYHYHSQGRQRKTNGTQKRTGGSEKRRASISQL